MKDAPPQVRLLYLAGIVYAVKMGTQGHLPREFPAWFEAEFTSADEDPEAIADRIIERAKAHAEHHRQTGGGDRPN